MIYAHMGLASDSQALEDFIHVDYKKSCAEVYEEACVYLAHDVGPQPLLVQSLRTRSEKRTPDLASWATDWSLPGPTIKVHDARNYREYHEALFIFIEKPLTLVILGSEVDAVRHFSVVLPPTLQPNLSYKSIIRDVEDFCERVGSAHYVSNFFHGTHISRSSQIASDDHQRLYLRFVNEWTQMVADNLLHSNSTIPDDEMRRQQAFFLEFKTILEADAKAIFQTMAGELLSFGDMANHMYLYLAGLENPAKRGGRKLLGGSRLAITASGGVASVPQNIQSGDKVISLAGSRYRQVFRHDPMLKGQDPELKEAFWANFASLQPYGFSRYELSPPPKKTIPLRRGVLVGECNCNERAGSVPWGKNREGIKDYAIYALR
jgi:hypothetical protein